MKKIFKIILNLPKYIALFLVGLFKFCISPFIPHVCKFTPTCSIYASQSFEQWGFFYGLVLSIKRLLRCNHKATPRLDTVPINPKGRYKYFM